MPVLEHMQGMALLAATSLVPALSPRDGATPTVGQLTLLYCALYVVALGTGGIKPNVSAFGADQFDDKSRVERREKQSFFNWFYFSINVGSLIACTVIVWIQARPRLPQSRVPGSLVSCSPMQYPVYSQPGRPPAQPTLRKQHFEWLRVSGLRSAL